METEELRGTFACPLCGFDKPHHHSDEQVAAYREDQIHQDDGWISAACRQPSRRGWYLCLGVAVDQDQFGKPANFGDRNDRWSQLSWFLWVRNGGARGNLNGEIPEVLFYEQSSGGWQLRNLLGNAIVSGAENRHEVFAQPKYWRELPANRNAARTAQQPNNEAEGGDAV